MSFYNEDKENSIENILGLLNLATANPRDLDIAKKYINQLIEHPEIKNDSALVANLKRLDPPSTKDYADIIENTVSTMTENKMNIKEALKNVLSRYWEDYYAGPSDDWTDEANYKGLYDNNPTGIANPADYMQTIKFTDSDEDGKPESVEIEKESNETLSDERLKDISDTDGKDQEDIRQKRINRFKDNWGETDEQKRRKGKQ